MSMTVDTAIRIVSHSAEVVQLYPHDTISLVCLASVDTTAHYLWYDGTAKSYETFPMDNAN